MEDGSVLLLSSVEDTSEPDYKEMLKTMRETNVLQWNCLLICYLFPQNYEFHKDDLIQLWLAQELPGSYQHFKAFEEMHVFIQSGLDSFTGQPRYKLNSSVFFLLQQLHKGACFIMGDGNSYISKTTRHSSVHVIDKDLYQAETLSTLLMHGSRIDQVPDELFLKLPLLRVLDLSYTGITELPSSIKNLKSLRYLNLSGTPIATLPNSVCNLYQMQTLKLKGCQKLLGLPKEIRKLRELCYLDVDVACLMASMPPGIGDLTQLRTLPAFVVGKEEGCDLTELRHMRNLCGTLRILRLENVSNGVEAANQKNCIEKLECIVKLELQWTEAQNESDFEVLENLQPRTQLQELEIIGFAGLHFPSWIGDPCFSVLVTITLHDCKNSKFVPPLGKLLSLKRLCLIDIHAVKAIDGQFCGRDMVTESLDFGHFAPKAVACDNIFRAFPSLGNLTLDGMLMLEEWSGIKKGDFHDLHKLNISGCPKLRTLPELVLFGSLQQLEISLCPVLESFPNEGLPTSLQYLIIIDCPLIKEWCHSEAKPSGKLAHVPNIWIDYQQISSILLTRQDEDGKTSDETKLLHTAVSSSESNLAFMQSVDPALDLKDEQEGENKKEMNLGKMSKGEYREAISSYGTSGSSGESLPLSEKLLQSSKLKIFSYAELKIATRNFHPTCALAKGMSGIMYKGWIDENNLSATKFGEGTAVAIKMLHRKLSQLEIKFLGKFYRHPNLVKLIGYCTEDEHWSLVYEYMPRGSLESNLFVTDEPLSWTRRMKVALGTAKGLAYLHYLGSPLFRCDFEASNIHLDLDYNAKLSATLFKSCFVTVGLRSVVEGLSYKSDVYGFGVVLLEMLCGRRAVDKNRPAQELNLVEWAKPYLSDRREVFRVLDKRLEGQYTNEAAQKAAQLALQCLSTDEKLRPTIMKVVEALEELQDPKDPKWKLTSSFTAFRKKKG